MTTIRFLSRFSHDQQRLVPVDVLSHHPRRTAAVAVGTLLVGLTVAVSPAQPAAAAQPLKGAGTCANIDLIWQPSSAFPDTPQGRVAYLRQNQAIEPAVLCLVNAERTAANLKPLKRWITLRGGRPGLGGAAATHVTDSVRLKWWGKVEPGKNCVPMETNPEWCDPHINPETGSKPLSRAQAAGYTRGCASYYVGENAYVGWGSSKVTPRAAVTWWMDSKPHRDTILNPVYTDTALRFAWGSADPAAGSTTPALTYVHMFGHCG